MVLTRYVFRPKDRERPNKRKVYAGICFRKYWFGTVSMIVFEKYLNLMVSWLGQIVFRTRIFKLWHLLNFQRCHKGSQRIYLESECNIIDVYGHKQTLCDRTFIQWSKKSIINWFKLRCKDLMAQTFEYRCTRAMMMSTISWTYSKW